MDERITETTVSHPVGKIRILHRDGDVDDSAVIREMFDQNVYRFHTWMLEQDRAVVLDVGANIGAFSLFVLAAARDADRPVTIYAVEPEINNRKLLARNLQANRFLFDGGSDVIIVPKGVSNFAGKSHITNRSGSSRLSEDRSLQEIDVITYDDLLSSNKIDKIDFVKIDIEGSEVELIDHASDESLMLGHYYAVEFDSSSTTNEFLGIADRFSGSSSISTWGVPADGCNLYFENHYWSAK